MNQGPPLLVASSLSTPFILPLQGGLRGTEKGVPLPVSTAGCLAVCLLRPRCLINPSPPGPSRSVAAAGGPEGSWPSFAGLHPYSLPGHLPLSAPTCRLPPGPGRGQGDHPPPCGPPISTHPPLKRCLAFPPLSAVSKVLGVEGGPPGSRAQK